MPVFMEVGYTTALGIILIHSMFHVFSILNNCPETSLIESVTFINALFQYVILIYPVSHSLHLPPAPIY